MRFLGYLPAVGWAAFVLFLGSRPFTDVPGYDLPLDKFAHFGLYGVLGALAAMGWRAAGRWPRAVIPLLAVLLVGALDELNQRRVATRSADWVDWSVDVIAAGTAFGLLARHRSMTGQGERG